MNRAGFTLLELVVAIAILAIALVGVTQIVSQGLNTTKEARDRNDAMELAEQKLAELLLNPDLVAGTEEGDFGDLYPRFAFQSEISETELEGLFSVKVTVLWQNGPLERSVDLETCYASNTLVDPVASTTDDPAAQATATAASPSSSSSLP